MGMAGGPVRLPLDNLDEKKTADLKKILATIPAAKKTAGAGSAGKPKETGRKEKSAVKPDMIKVVVCGASGRMGQTIGRMVKESQDLELVGGIDLRPGTFFGADICCNTGYRDTS